MPVSSEVLFDDGYVRAVDHRVSPGEFRQRLAQAGFGNSPAKCRQGHFEHFGEFGFGKSCLLHLKIERKPGESSGKASCPAGVPVTSFDKEAGKARNDGNQLALNTPSK